MIDQNLFSRSELFRVTVEQSPIPMTVQDQNMTLVLVNPAYCELVGYNEEELLGQDPLKEIISPVFDYRTRQAREQATRVLDEELPSRMTVLRELVHRDGQLVPVRLEVTIAQGIDGSRLWCSTLIDLSGQQQAVNDVLRDQDLMMRELHHRVKNNLHGIIGLIGRESAKNAQLKTSLDRVASKIKVVANVHGLQLNQTGVLLNPVELVESVVASSAQLFEPAFKCMITDSAQGSKWSVEETDAVPFALIINELITNAGKHHQGTEPPQIIVSGLNDGLRIRITNPGELPENFDLSTHRSHRGGLGLVKSLISGNGLELNIVADGPVVIADLIVRPPVLNVSDS